MLDQTLWPAVLVLLGTIVGAVAGVLGSVVQARSAHRSDFRRAAIEMGLREWEQGLQHLRESGGGTILPPAVFVHHHMELLRLIDGGKLTRARYERLIRESDEFRQAVVDDDARRRERNGQERNR